MTRKIDFEQAASWSEEDTAANIEWLATRLRYDDVQRIQELRAAGDKAEPTKGAPEGSEAWIGEATANEIVEWVADSKQKAQFALGVEVSRPDPRKKLSEKLTAIIDAD